jgi:SAM-dependent methyltransferase
VSECRSCGGADFERVYSGLRDFFQGTPIAEDYGRCSRCGLLQAESSRRDLGPLYGDYTLHQRRGKTFRTIRQLVLRAGYDRPRPPYRGAQLLDYGCGDGSYLRAMARRGWTVAGIEMNARYAEKLSRELGAPVRAADADHADWGDRFDHLTLNFSLEHVERPREVLRGLLPLLRPGGTLYACIPNIEGREAQLFGSRWFDLDPPRHRTFFTRAQLGRLLEEEGYTELRFRTVSLPTSFAGSLHRIVAQRCDPRVHALLLPLGEAWSAVFRDGCLKVWARRPA